MSTSRKIRMIFLVLGQCGLIIGIALCSSVMFLGNRKLPVFGAVYIFFSLLMLLIHRIMLYFYDRKKKR